MMEFLEEQMLAAKTLSNLEATGSMEDAAEDVTLDEDSLGEAATPPELQAKKPKGSNELKKQLINLEENKLEMMSRAFKDPADEELDFFINLIPYIKLLDQVSKLMVRQEIQAVVMRAVQKFEQNKL
ncbi:hypothetical protein FKM82_009976 [Ascaphus truei]